MDNSNWSIPTRIPEKEPQEPRRGWLWAVLAVVLVGLGAGSFWYFRHTRQAASVTPVAVPDSSALDAGQTQLGQADTGATDGGPLNVEEEIRRISPDSTYAQWTKEPNLVGRFAAVVANVADGSSPRALLSFLAPEGKFAVEEDASGIYLSPKGTQRYDIVARVIKSIDASAAARAYAVVRPALQSAFSQISRRGQTIDGALSKALHRLIAVPLPKGEIKLVAKGAVYAFEDPELEALRPAEKHLLRMGPRNAEVIQQKCQELLTALKLPPSPASSGQSR